MLRELGEDEYSRVLADHRRIVREAAAAYGGVEVDTQGDAFFLAFPTAGGALDAARAIGEGLASGRIRVRTGIHTGTPLLGGPSLFSTSLAGNLCVPATGSGLVDNSVDLPGPGSVSVTGTISVCALTGACNSLCNPCNLGPLCGSLCNPCALCPEKERRYRRGRKRGRVTSSFTLSNTTSTGIPIESSSFGQSRMVECRRMPSSSSMIATL